MTNFEIEAGYFEANGEAEIFFEKKLKKEVTSIRNRY